MRKFKFIFILVCICLIISCNNKPNSQAEKSKERLKLTIPNEFNLQCNLKSNKKIFVILNTECPNCLDELKEWESIINTEIELFCIYIILTGNNQSFINYLLKQENFKNKIFVDKNDKFIDLNHFLKQNDRTIIIDSSKKIIAKGTILEPGIDLRKELNLL